MQREYQPNRTAVVSSRPNLRWWYRATNVRSCRDNLVAVLLRIVLYELKAGCQAFLVTRPASCLMQRFKPGSAVLILPRYARLFSSITGTVVDVKVDMFLSMFNEYTVKFEDGTTASVFEFELIEGGLNCQTVIAATVADRSPQPTTGEVDATGGRLVVLQTTSTKIDMKIEPSTNHASITGIILKESVVGLAGDVEVTLFKNNVPLATTLTDSMGIFKFIAVPRGPL